MTEVKGRTISQSVGKNVRRVVNASHSPAIINPGRFAEWNSIYAFFGGSNHSICALKWAIKISKLANVPIKVLTELEAGKKKSDYEKLALEGGISPESLVDWQVRQDESLVEIFNTIPRESMIVMGAYGSRKFRSSLFGSKTELALSINANLLMLVGESADSPIMD